MCIALPAEQADEALRLLKSSGTEASLIGEVTEGNGGVELC